MSFNFFPATQENALPLHIYREGGAYCRLSHLRYGTTNTVIKKIRQLDVPTHLAEQGQQLLTGLDALLQKLDAPSWLQSAGHPSWSFLLISDSANHSSWLLKIYGEILPTLIRPDAEHAIHEALDGEPIQPVLKVRELQPNAGNSENGACIERAYQLLKGPNETCR